MKRSRRKRLAFKGGAPGWIRTTDALAFNQPLYLLSYRRMRKME